MPRVEVLKTYKIAIGGQLPRTESGRYYPLTGKNGTPLANVSLSSRKDLRNAVVAARSACGGWSGRAAFNRGQILYRIAEMMEGRKAQFIDELMLQGSSRAAAEKEVTMSIDRLVYYSGWCDKYQQSFGTVNPVASSHFNFSVPEPTGVVAIVAPEESGLLGLVSVVAPCIAGGNTCVVLASEQRPLSSITFAEVLATSDVPGGVVNILTGTTKELLSHFASHMDVNALVYCRHDAAEKMSIVQLGAGNVKRTMVWEKDWTKDEQENPYLLLELQEIKTTWHPIENIGASGAKY
ncbi:MAG: aldehyde dehydrogenase family protein [Bacteroidetes bacterium]|nr:aldehyde dehydrogenase family protein [Bacteroidota bacterium]